MEALLKAMGTGFSTDPRDFDRRLGNREAVITFRGSHWSVASLEVPSADRGKQRAAGRPDILFGRGLL